MECVTTYYLEMRSLDQLKAKPAPAALDLTIQEMALDSWQINRFLYQYVGQPWQWTDRLSLTEAQWQAYVANPKMKTWIAYLQGTMAGYFELLQSDDGNTEIHYFGLAVDFIGLGIGGALLTTALQAAWAMPGTRRVWVHTCSLDHPSALNNYRARGMTLYKTTKSIE